MRHPLCWFPHKRMLSSIDGSVKYTSCRRNLAVGGRIPTRRRSCLWGPNPYSSFACCSRITVIVVAAGAESGLSLIIVITAVINCWNCWSLLSHWQPPLAPTLFCCHRRHHRRSRFFHFPSLCLCPFTWCRYLFITAVSSFLPPVRVVCRYFA